MTPLHNHRVAWQLLGGLIATLILFIGAQIFAELTLNAQHEYAQKVYRRHLEGAVQLAGVQDKLWRLRYGFPQYLVLGDAEKKQILEEEPVLYDGIFRHLANYANLVRDEEEKKQLVGLQAAFQRYVNARPHWFELLNANKPLEAAEWRAKTTTPYGKETVVKTEKLIALQQQNAEIEAKTLQSSSESMAIIYHAILAIALCATVVLIAMVWRILRTLRQAQEFARDSASKLLGETLLIEERDEIDTLVTTVHLMIKRFAEHSQELNQAQQQLLNQHLILENQVTERTQDLQKSLRSSEQQTWESQLLSELADRLQICNDLQDAQTVITAFAPKIFVGMQGTLFLMNASRNLLDKYVVWGEHEETIEQTFYPEACWALRRGKGHWSDKNQIEVPCTHLHLNEGASLCLPLLTQDGVIGVLTISFAANQPHTEYEAFFNKVATQMGLALSNLKLREKLRQQSIRDPLTGLFNRRFFEETLDREFARAVRLKQAVALMMLDVDHFKRFNDNYGHDVGDRVLELVGRIIRQKIRISDTPCRLGGEEFVVILPNITRETAYQQAERIRLAIQDESALHSGQRYVGAVNVSIGVALYPEHAQEADPLIMLADKALYQAKQNGRNQVCMAGEIAAVLPPPTPQENSGIPK